MKTVLMALMLCIGMGTLCAQKTGNKSPDYYKKGELQLGIDPQFGISFQQSGIALNHLKLGASGGIFLADKFMVGIRGEFNFQRFQTANNRIYRGHGITGSIFSKYYFTRGKFSPFVELGGGRVENFYNGENRPHNGSFFVEGRVGMAYRLSKKVSFEASYFRKQFETNSYTPAPKSGIKLGVNFHF